MGIITAWWLTYPSEKYEFVNGKDYPIYCGKQHIFETTSQIILGTSVPNNYGLKVVLQHGHTILDS